MLKNTTKFGVVLTISFLFFLTEITVGLRTKSLALIADSFHYLNDIVAYAISFFAAYLQERGQHTHSFTYAFHRAELVGAFFNGVFLLGLALSIFLQSIERFFHVEVVTSPELVLIIGGVGLALNILSVIFVHDHHHHHGHDSAIPMEPIELKDSYNREGDHIHAMHHHRLHPPVTEVKHDAGVAGVMLHLLGDAVNNIGVIIASVIMMKVDSPKRFYADPAVSLLISLIISASAIPLTRRTGRILLEASPVHLDLAKIKQDLLSVPDVLSLHDLHVWHLSQSIILGSVHICVPFGMSLERWEKTEGCLQCCFEEFGITHVTISPEVQRNSLGPDAIESSEDIFFGSCRLPSKDDFGCTVGTDVKKRKVIMGSVA